MHLSQVHRIREGAGGSQAAAQGQHAGPAHGGRAGAGSAAAGALCVRARHAPLQGPPALLEQLAGLLHSHPEQPPLLKGMPSVYGSHWPLVYGCHCNCVGQEHMREGHLCCWSSSRFPLGTPSHIAAGWTSARHPGSAVACHRQGSCFCSRVWMAVTSCSLPSRELHKLISLPASYAFPCHAAGMGPDAWPAMLASLQGLVQLLVRNCGVQPCCSQQNPVQQEIKAASSSCLAALSGSIMTPWLPAGGGQGPAAAPQGAPAVGAGRSLGV